MKGQFRWSVDRVVDAAGNVMSGGVRSFMLFGVVPPGMKDAEASAALADDGVVQDAIRSLKSAYGDSIYLFTDVCVCEYTGHGHCGALSPDGSVANDASLTMLCEMALSHARAGADAVAPSAMMDGQVAAIRRALDSDGFDRTLLLAYSTKFASAFYGPFREAACSAPGKGDRGGYQADYRNLGCALRESQFDECEGADMLMVKPSLLYLDVIARIREQSKLPLVAYNVSGEYAMLQTMADKGYGDLKSLVRESIAALDRAGSDLIISYWANQYDQLFR